MAELFEVKPTQRNRIIDLVQEAGIDVSDWANFKGGQARAATNPKYCYEWSHIQRDKIILNLWYAHMEVDNEGRIIQRVNFRNRARRDAKSQNELIWKARSIRADAAVRFAYKSQLPIRIIVCDGVMRKRNDESAKPSQVRERMLDPVPWGVLAFEPATGEYILARGVSPTEPDDNFELGDEKLEGIEGKPREKLVIHRKRERRLRHEKIQDALHKNGGRLICEVPNCGFDFLSVYGDLGEGFAEVHHIIPLRNAPPEGLKITLEDLAVVCSNCHSMIHRNGECRDMDSLIPKRKESSQLPR